MLPLKMVAPLKKFFLLAAATSPLLLMPVSRAANIVINNPGFESNTISTGTFVVIEPTGWTIYDPLNIVNNADNAVGLIYPDNQTTFFSLGAPEGNNAALIYLAGGANGEVGLQQTLADTLQANTRYTLSVQVGNINEGTSILGKSDGGGVYYNLLGFPGYRIDLLAGNTVIASDNNSLAGTMSEGGFRLATLIFDTPIAHPQIGQALSIRMVNLDLPGTVATPNIEVDFDDVSLTAIPIASTSIPEPSGIGGLMFLLIGAIFSSRRV